METNNVCCTWQTGVCANCRELEEARRRAIEDLYSKFHRGILMAAEFAEAVQYVI